MKLHATTRPAHDTTAQAVPIVVDLDDHAGDWDAALAAARAKVPAGHVLLYVQRGG